ncbi:hypothetical protein SEVIR_5G013075v4 [Setaria viridis]
MRSGAFTGGVAQQPLVSASVPEDSSFVAAPGPERSSSGPTRRGSARSRTGEQGTGSPAGTTCTAVVVAAGVDLDERAAGERGGVRTPPEHRVRAPQLEPGAEDPSQPSTTPGCVKKTCSLGPAHTKVLQAVWQHRRRHRQGAHRVQGGSGGPVFPGRCPHAVQDVFRGRRRLRECAAQDGLRRGCGCCGGRRRQRGEVGCRQEAAGDEHQWRLECSSSSLTCLA